MTNFPKQRLPASFDNKIADATFKSGDFEGLNHFSFLTNLLERNLQINLENTTDFLYVVDDPSMDFVTDGFGEPITSSQGEFVMGTPGPGQYNLNELFQEKVVDVIAITTLYFNLFFIH